MCHYSIEEVFDKISSLACVIPRVDPAAVPNAMQATTTGAPRPRVATVTTPPKANVAGKM